MLLNGFARYGKIALGSAFPLVLLLLAALPQTTAAQPSDPDAPLEVGVFVDPPFVMSDGEGYVGMAIDLWEQVADGLGRDYTYVELETIRDLLDATAAEDIDVAVTNLTINRPRAERVDFTQPWFDGGMRIMIATDQSSGFSQLVSGLKDAGFLRAYAWIGLVILIATALLTFFDRRFDTAFPQRWRDGLAESFYAVMSVVTSGRPPARKNLFGWTGRIWQGLWLVCGIAVLAFVTSSVTSVMTTLSLTGHIESLEDLDDEPIGALTGTVGEDYARAQGLRVRTYRNLDDAVAALLESDVAAVLADAPVLEYHAHTNPGLPVDVVGPLVEPDKYGFAVPLQSPLRRLITVELLGAIAAGDVETMRARYFGAQD